ncbi:transglutaminase N-terminal domain-containing protein [Planctomyces sp. SH-PL14]|uniref:transglutaminase family protein n=1 Tax=Planctomyces sp. SH-PL14 TaxID=1632864 RepID=UPI00078D5B9A|nr:transglutaminase family protein [Planctomyces sp. SH-PL14]AMV16381.1 Protein-glutamine gamma-glutamyltransferase [Planctomyces sp. SH-PL14]
MKYRIVHITRYSGTEPISVGHNEAWLTPRDSTSQKCLNHTLDIRPEPSITSRRTDYFGNTVTQFSFNQGYRALTVTAVNEVDLQIPTRPTTVDPAWETVVESVRRHQTPEDLTAYEFGFDSPRCKARDEFAEYGRVSFYPGRPILEALSDLMRRIHTEFRYDTLATSVTTPVDQVFKLRKGVCQDFSHLMISILRSLGLAACYVSGYLRTLPPPGRPRLVGADASHAWLSAWCGPMGWVDLDPTNNKIPDVDHITVARGRDYGDVAPLKGVYIGGGKHELTVSVDVSEVEAGAGAPVQTATGVS